MSNEEVLFNLLREAVLHEMQSAIANSVALRICSASMAGTMAHLLADFCDRRARELPIEMYDPEKSVGLPLLQYTQCADIDIRKRATRTFNNLLLRHGYLPAPK